MKVPDHVLDDFEVQVGPFETKVALTGEAEAPIAIVRFKDFDDGGVPRSHHTIFFATSTLKALKDMLAGLDLETPIEQTPTTPTEALT